MKKQNEFYVSVTVSISNIWLNFQFSTHIYSSINITDSNTMIHYENHFVFQILYFYMILISLVFHLAITSSTALRLLFTLPQALTMAKIRRNYQGEILRAESYSKKQFLCFCLYKGVFRSSLSLVVLFCYRIHNNKTTTTGGIENIQDKLS